MTPTYFGEPWDVPALDGAVQAPTPIGRPCITCESPIENGDRGWLRPTVISDRLSLVAIHAECELATIVGHTVGICGCTGWPVNNRYTGLAVWRHVMDRYGPQAHPHDPTGATIGGGTHCADPGDTARIDTRAVRDARRPWWQRLRRRLHLRFFHDPIECACELTPADAPGWRPSTAAADYLRSRDAR